MFFNSFHSVICIDSFSHFFSFTRCVSDQYHLSSPHPDTWNPPRGVEREDFAPSIAKMARKEPGAGKALLRTVTRYSEPLDHVLRIIGLIAAVASGTAMPLMTIVFGAAVNDFNQYGAGESSSTYLYHSMSKNALYFVYLFIGRYVLVYIYSVCFGVAGIRTMHAFRMDFIKSMIRQDVAFLDSCSPGTITSLMSNNANLVDNGLNEKIGSLLQAVSMLVAAFAVAFAKQWQLTFVTATTLPVLFAGFYITFRLGMVPTSLYTS